MMTSFLFFLALGSQRNNNYSAGLSMSVLCINLEVKATLKQWQSRWFIILRVNERLGMFKGQLNVALLDYSSFVFL